MSMGRVPDMFPSVGDNDEVPDEVPDDGWDDDDEDDEEVPDAF